ncbi:T9SS type A sorting domain-containing protein [Aureisphaera galaxeae]|uniref:T9SS type A sorting domain-containing protein n=1 Tax=Aureisphaera galaxeae TaxID=1538023 RepID=UPI002350A7F3|nr:T9SS type A sorting domain-containing protein [Aureisphaera galaxeae]MDC8004619.1 T9SS type A sorting domain-containing protein [Aureisphaera galaxeae]
MITPSPILKIVFVLSFLLTSFAATAQGRVKMMFYNLLEFPEGQAAWNRELLLREIINTYEPDILMVCELQSQEGADEILEVSLNDGEVVYTAPPFVDNQSGGADLQQLVFYREDKFQLLQTDIIVTNVRDINRYELQLNTANGDVDPVVLDLYVSHLKASQGGENELLRLGMVTDFTDTLGDLDPNSYVIFAGDLNLYTSTEPAYIELLDDTNPIVLVDPISTPGSWSSNEDFTAVHTQSTRVSSGPFGTGAGGGLDDRFDFILMSENMETDPKLRYVPDTYLAYGNNGNCFNLSINNTGCTGTFGSSLRSNLYNMSDHLPVVMELETNQEIVLNGTDFVAESPLEITNTWVESNLRLIIRSNEVKDLLIYDMLGKKMMQLPIETTGEKLLDLSHFPSGVYLLTTSQNNFYPIKLIKGN